MGKRRLLVGVLTFVILCGMLKVVSRETYAGVIQQPYAILTPAMPAPGDKIHLLGHSSTSLIGVDESKGIEAEKDGTFHVLSVLIWNPALRIRMGDAIDASVVDIDCQHNTYNILTDASLDAHWHLIKVHPVKPKVMGGDPRALGMAVVNYVCRPPVGLTGSQQST